MSIFSSGSSGTVTSRWNHLWLLFVYLFLYFKTRDYATIIGAFWHMFLDARNTARMAWILGLGISLDGSLEISQVTVHGSPFPVHGWKNRELKSISKTPESLDLVHHFGQLNSFLLILILLLLQSGLRARKKTATMSKANPCIVYWENCDLWTDNRERLPSQ